MTISDNLVYDINKKYNQTKSINKSSTFRDDFFFQCGTRMQERAKQKNAVRQIQDIDRTIVGKETMAG